MRELKQNVIVINSNQQVLKGLALLLQDMNFNVTATTDYHQLEDVSKSQAECPDLLIFPFTIEAGKSSINLVKDLRVSFHCQIPAILVTSEIVTLENGSNDKQTIDANTLVLSDRVKPGELRQKINQILDNCLKENCDE